MVHDVMAFNIRRLVSNGHLPAPRTTAPEASRVWHQFGEHVSLVSVVLSEPIEVGNWPRIMARLIAVFGDAVSGAMHRLTHVYTAGDKFASEFARWLAGALARSQQASIYLVVTADGSVAPETPFERVLFEHGQASIAVGLAGSRATKRFYAYHCCAL